MVSRSWFGTWMPTVDLPDMRSIRMLSARSARQRSSHRLVMRLYLMPASGLNSKVVTTGPGLICTTWPRTSNSAHFSASTCARCFQFELVDGAVLVGTVQQRGGRQLVAADQARHGRLAARRAVGARADGDVFGAGLCRLSAAVRTRRFRPRRCARCRS